LDSDELTGGYNRKTVYYAEDDVDAIIKVMDNREEVPRYPGLTYLYDVCRELGVSEKTLRRKMAKHEPPVAMVKKPGKCREDGRALPLSYVPTWYVEHLKTERFAKLDEDDITAPEVAKELECSIGKVHSLEGLTKFHRQLARVYGQKRRGQDTQCRGVRSGITFSRKQVREAKLNGIWPPCSTHLDPKWKHKEAIARKRGAQPGPRRNDLYKEINEAAKADPSIQKPVYRKNSKGRWHPRNFYDTERLYPLLDANNKVERPPDGWKTARYFEEICCQHGYSVSHVRARLKKARKAGLIKHWQPKKPVPVHGGQKRRARHYDPAKANTAIDTQGKIPPDALEMILATPADVMPVNGIAIAGSNPVETQLPDEKQSRHGETGPKKASRPGNPPPRRSALKPAFPARDLESTSSESLGTQEQEQAKALAEQTSPVARAIALMLQYDREGQRIPPVKTLAQMAGTSKPTLYRDPQFRATRQALKAKRRGFPPKGYKTPDGDIETYGDDVS
jgi:hypothetical protein